MRRALTWGNGVQAAMILQPSKQARGVTLYATPTQHTLRIEFQRLFCAQQCVWVYLYYQTGTDTCLYPHLQAIPWTCKGIKHMHEAGPESYTLMPEDHAQLFCCNQATGITVSNLGPGAGATESAPPTHSTNLCVGSIHSDVGVAPAKAAMEHGVMHAMKSIWANLMASVHTKLFMAPLTAPHRSIPYRPSPRPEHESPS